MTKDVTQIPVGVSEYDLETMQKMEYEENILRKKQKISESLANIYIQNRL